MLLFLKATRDVWKNLKFTHSSHSTSCIRKQNAEVAEASARAVGGRHEWVVQPVDQAVGVCLQTEGDTAFFWNLNRRSVDRIAWYERHNWNWSFKPTTTLACQYVDFLARMLSVVLASGADTQAEFLVRCLMGVVHLQIASAANIDLEVERTSHLAKSGVTASRFPGFSRTRCSFYFQMYICCWCELKLHDTHCHACLKHKSLDHTNKQEDGKSHKKCDKCKDA
jgi:hypothetical protein